MVIKKADMIIDLQFGSTGKGLMAGYLAVKNGYDVVVTANMPNAGHTFIDDRGNKMIHKVLPNGIVSPECRWALIGPGAVFDPIQLFKELDDAFEMGYHGFVVGIHPNAVVLTENHKLYEQGYRKKIGSTAQGSAAAMIHKMHRNPNDNPTAWAKKKLFDSPVFKVLTCPEYRAIIQAANSVLLEGAQGFSLGINQMFYPYCTSRECTPARFLSDMGVPVSMLRDVIGTARVHPIRVADPEGGSSGGYYPDQVELQWDDLGVTPERTTVTDRIRRVFTWSNRQMVDALWECDPNKIFLNFCNYANDHELVRIRGVIGPRIAYEGWGPTINDVKEINHG